MKAAIGIASLLAVSVSPAWAIDLSCKGMMHTYGSTPMEGAVEPGATVVDLDQKSITTPIGDFRITTVTDASVSFDDPTEKRLVVFGTLDRISGRMTVFWRNPRDNTKMARYGELQCSAAKRLF